ncbi:MAG: hypothetical protein EAZ14_02475 [Runella slithyformis]|nr:MAG: hypothetical protein EAZ14_02475 [Runella slithyformis]
MKNWLLLLFLGTALCPKNTLRAQCRPATAEENQAYERVVRVLQQQFAQKLPSTDWRVFDENHSMGSLEVTNEYAGGLLHFCTDRYDLVVEKAKLTNARQEKLESLKPDSTQQTAFVVPRDSIYRLVIENANASAPSSDTYSINVEMNLANYRLQEAESARLVESSKNMEVDGVKTALQVLLKPEFKNVAARQETVLLLGNWGKPQTEPNGDIRYRYGFKKGGKLIESLVITITASFELAQQIVKNTDWKAINDALVK